MFKIVVTLTLHHEVGVAGNPKETLNPRVCIAGDPIAGADRCGLPADVLAWPAPELHLRTALLPAGRERLPGHDSFHALP